MTKVGQPQPPQCRPFLHTKNCSWGSCTDWTSTKYLSGCLFNSAISASGSKALDYRNKIYDMLAVFTSLWRGTRTMAISNWKTQREVFTLARQALGRPGLVMSLKVSSMKYREFYFPTYLVAKTLPPSWLIVLITARQGKLKGNRE